MAPPVPPEPQSGEPGQAEQPQPQPEQSQAPPQQLGSQQLGSQVAGQPPGKQESPPGGSEQGVQSHESMPMVTPAAAVDTAAVIAGEGEVEGRSTVR